uniref:Uncharacterized protein n=1 Tax=Anguilla anguilla TaxID=7936 RepID=A0A0E9U1I2_ANGAN
MKEFILHILFCIMQAVGLIVDTTSFQT